jgi:serine/threonine-protein kinase SRPK3
MSEHSKPDGRQPQILTRPSKSTRVLALMFQQCRPSGFDFIENINLYRSGGLHPVSIGDVFAGGRYKVLHKLGFGGSSTIWLARDSVSGILVALKVLAANTSTKPKDEIEELVVSQKLDALIASTHSAARHNIQTIKDSFIQEGPNGTHVCLVSELAGPSVYAMSFFGCEGRLEGSRRLRSDLARKVAKQTATVMELMHSVGLVHGGSFTLFHNSALLKFLRSNVVKRPFSGL